MAWHWHSIFKRAKLILASMAPLHVNESTIMEMENLGCSSQQIDLEDGVYFTISVVAIVPSRVLVVLLDIVQLNLLSYIVYLRFGIYTCVSYVLPTVHRGYRASRLSSVVSMVVGKYRPLRISYIHSSCMRHYIMNRCGLPPTCRLNLERVREGTLCTSQRRCPG